MILADPPWRWDMWAATGKVMKLPVAALAADDCALFLWCTGPHIAIGSLVKVIEAWGFCPSTIAFVCIRGDLRGGDDFYYSDKGCQIELCLLATKGSPQRLATDIHQVVEMLCKFPTRFVRNQANRAHAMSRSRGMTDHRRAEITVFEKSGGSLTKRISLAADGSVKSDGSACVMARSAAWRLPIADAGELAAFIEKVRSEQAHALSSLRAGLPNKVQVVTKRNFNGQLDTIARTAADINYHKERPRPGRWSISTPRACRRT